MFKWLVNRAIPNNKNQGIISFKLIRDIEIFISIILIATYINFERKNIASLFNAVYPDQVARSRII